MPWIRAGSVAVTTGSTTVTGTNADFAANARNGDSFIGPDGRNYEISNVASATVLSILPAYQGATASGAAYSIMPVQGYDKALSDAFNNLNNQFGTKLAALGTTGNYDILPASKGGTGLTAVGTAISSNITTSNSDTTVGRLIKVGDFGIGNLGGPLSVTDANTALIGGAEYRLNSPYTNGPTAGPYTIRVSRYDNEVTQFASQEGALQGAMFLRKRSGTVTWGDWDPIVKGGPNSSITNLSGLTTALSIAQGGTGVTSVLSLLGSLMGSGAYSKQNVLGTVSQSGGAPTGAVIERGSNANGEYIKFADGTMICTATIQFNSVAITNAYGASSWYGGIAWTLPMAFTAVPHSSCTALATGRLLTAVSTTSVTSSSLPYYVYDLAGASTQTVYTRWFAIGRWF